MRLARYAIPHISPRVRFLTLPPRVLAQKAQPIAQPTCDETQTVSLPSSIPSFLMSTDSM